MNILMIGDIYSQNGRDIVQKKIKEIVTSNNISFIVANGENISHGKGIAKKHYKFLKDIGVNVITSGNHIFKNSQVLEYIDDVKDLLKPANMSKYTPGIGTTKFKIKGKIIRVTNLMGRVFMEPCSNPYESFEEILENDNSDIHLVDFHAEATAEKAAFAYYYDGKITAFVGTHTHVQTADERLLPKGTAFITDLGFCGAYNSIIGANIEEVIKKEKTGMPVSFKPASGLSQFCGAIIKIDDKTNKAISIERVFIKEKDCNKL